MDVDRLSPEERSTLMRKGACFICKEPGHMARYHKEHEEKKKKKASSRWTKAESSKITKTTKTMTGKKDINKIHALLQSLSPDGTSMLFTLQNAEQNKKEEEKKDKKDDDDSDLGF